MTELKPCPFCGAGMEHLNVLYGDVDDRANLYDPCVICKNCGIVLKFRGEKRYTGSLDDILKVWNRRVRE